MKLNILAYCIYIVVTFIIIVVVGQVFYRNGRRFILALFHNDEDAADRVNHLLLLGYYLFNLGYALLRIHRWEPITELRFLTESLADSVATIIIILSLMHYGNMLAIYLYSQNSNSVDHHTISNQ